MISEKDKAAILAGAVGLTRNNQKVKLVCDLKNFFVANKNIEYPYLFIVFNETYIENSYAMWYTEDLEFFKSKDSELDIIKLWNGKNKLEKYKKQ